MVKIVRIVLIAMGSMAYFASCNKCKVENFSLSKVDYNGNAIKLEGYYHSVDVDYSNDTTYSFIILYRNGVLVEGGAYNSLEEIENSFVTNAFINQKRTSRYKWGIYELTNDSIIRTQRWYPVLGCKDGADVISEDMNIINDTLLRRNTGGEMFFNPFSPKPDSTNNFIP